MKIKDFVLRFLITFGAALIAAVLTTIFWSYFIKEDGLMIDWETSFRMALVFAIVIPLTQIRKK
jgi:hypothetical protein